MGASGQMGVQSLLKLETSNLQPPTSNLKPQTSQAELIIANFFIMNWLVTLYVTPARIGYLFGYESIIDITTCIPVYLSICRAAQDVRSPLPLLFPVFLRPYPLSLNLPDHPRTRQVDTGILRTTRVYRLTRILRVFRMLRPVTLVARDAFSNPIKAHLFKIVSWFTITLLIISGVVQVAAKYDQGPLNSTHYSTSAPKTALASPSPFGFSVSTIHHPQTSGVFFGT